MMYQSFHEILPDIAEKETRFITLFKDNDFSLPEDEYAFVEMFCNDTKCDCRRVFFQVFSMKKNQSEAVICWGWENAAFYSKWMGFDDKEMLKELIGPALNVGSPQSVLAPSLLKMLSQILLTDETYVERVKKHYALFKNKIAHKKK